MTDAEIIAAAIRDPVVIRARSTTKSDGTMVSPLPNELLQDATTELAAEISGLLSDEEISRALLEREHTVSLSTGGTDVQQGTWYEIPNDVGLIIAATIGTTRKPLDLMTSREEFNRWWYFNHGEQDTSGESEVAIQWNPTASETRTILISPGIGSDTTLYLLHRRRVTQYNSTLFNTEDHHLLLLGLKNRLSGGQFETGYRESLNRIKSRIAPILYRPTGMRRDRRVELLGWRLMNLYGGGSSSDLPRYYRTSS